MTSEPSVPKIQVGGDFKFGDVSGQIAIGENTTQTQIFYKDCTFILPNGSTVQGKSWLYTQGIRPTTDPNSIFGRQRELDEIDKLFKQCTALAITGFRGTGKSTLASIYLDIIEKRVEYAGIFWRKMDETIDFSDVVGSFFTAIGKPVQDAGRYKIEDLINLLFRELNAAPYFLVLDNFEILLDPQNNKPKKPGFSDLIEKATENAGRSHVIFTSWECPASDRGKRPTLYTLGGLDEPAAIQLLRQRGLTEPENELKEAIKLSGGHPLALVLLVQLVKEGAETLPSILKDDTLWKGEVAENILDKVYKERLSEEERKLLQYVSLHREPIPLKAIASVAHDSTWTEAFVKKTALGLTRKSLLQKTGENYWEESLIHSYAYNKLVDRVERHKLACHYYLTILPEKRTKKDDVQSLIEACYHACKAEEYYEAFRILSDKNLYEDLDRWGEFRTLIELYSGLLPEDHFSDNILLSDKQSHGVVLGNLGTAYSQLCQVKKAVEYYQKALAIAQEIGDRKNEGVHMGNLGLTYYFLGQVKKAIEYYQKSLAIAQEIGDRSGEGNTWGSLGLAYNQLGQVEKAIEHYQKALAIAQEIGDRRNIGNCQCNLGNAYSQLGQVEKAIEHYQNVLAISQEIGDKKGEGNAQGNLGLAYNQLGQVEKAIEHYQNALAIEQEIEDRSGEGNCLGNLGTVYIQLGQVEKAIEHYQKALAIAQEIGDRRREGNCLGNLGTVYIKLGQVEKAIEHYQNALAIAQEIGDRRGKGNRLGNLGNAYSQLGQVEKAIEHYQNALAIAQEIRDRKEEGNHLNNLGLAFRMEKKYREALACYLLARKIQIQLKGLNFKTTESNLNNLKEALGENGFEKLVKEVEPAAEEIVRKILE